MAAQHDVGALKKRGFIQQRQKDYLVLRLRIVAGTLPADHLTILKDLAKQYGSGELHLTTRQCVEIPFIKVEDAATVADKLEAAGVRLGRGGPAVRTVTGCPGSRVCPRGLIDSRGLAEDIDARYYGSTAPHKFKVAISGCPSGCVKPQINDFGVWGIANVACEAAACNACGACAKACRSSAIVVDGFAKIDHAKCVGCATCTRTCPKGALSVVATTYAVSVGGKMGRAPRFGDRLPLQVSSEEGVLSLLPLVLDYYHREGKPGERLSDTLQRTGVDTLVENLSDTVSSTPHKV